ncbi:MAG TPA: GMC oxidoreductase [Acidimicrobiales bacterium]|jgi:hypothetical protein|nr:GMC oxidoreductase [Acidimicrobiales bacterium]
MPFRPPNAKAVTPGGRGRFPGFDVLDEVDRWDDVTAGVVLARLDPQPELCFFTPAEQACADALFDQLLGQDAEPKVPVLLLVDRRLALGQTDGWRYEDMPEDAEAWRATLAALDDVVALDAGPFWDPDADWVSDEAGSHRLYWTEPRFHPSDFCTYSADGVGADWPIDYNDLRPFYQAIEDELPVSGQDWPWGDPHSYRYSPQPVGGNGGIFLRGAVAIGLEARVGPVAIANGRFGNRPHCIYRGFCLQGCKVNAKASPLVTHIPDALAHGAEVRADCMVSRVEVATDGLTTGVAYFRDGVERFQRARMVAVAGYSIERYAHLVGGCRMAADDLHGVVDANQRTFAVPNLYLSDGSVLPTQGSANPALTIMALAARCADRLIAGSRTGLRATAAAR